MYPYTLYTNPIPYPTSILPTQVSHDPDRKIALPRNIKFNGVFIKKCLTKEYPQEGDYAGGIIFRRCYGQGAGVGFTRAECEAMWGAHKLKDHVMLVHNEVGVGSGNPNDTADTDPAVSTADADGGTTTDAAGACGTAAGGVIVAGADPTSSIQVGDSVEVWWDGEEEWFTGIITDKKSDINNNTVWKWNYDDGVTQ